MKNKSGLIEAFRAARLAIGKPLSKRNATKLLNRTITVEKKELPNE